MKNVEENEKPKEQDKLNLILTKVLLVLLVFFGVTAVMAKALKDLQSKNMKSMWEKNTQINLSEQGKKGNFPDISKFEPEKLRNISKYALRFSGIAYRECERKLTEAEESFKMQIQDRVDGMKKLLDRESQRCQDMVKNVPQVQKSQNENSDSTDDVDGLKSIIERQNQIIDQYRLKVVQLEDQLKRSENKL